jgi:hypothetical protein
MRAVFGDKEFALSKAQTGARLLRETLSMKAVSAVIAEVLS